MDNDNNENAENNEEGQEWGEPPLPEEIGKENAEEPQMSEVSTLFGIFLEPGKTFDDLRRKPRFFDGRCHNRNTIESFRDWVTAKTW